MSDPPKGKKENTSGWTMADPVFRSTEGHTPLGLHDTIASDDIPTEPGFRDAETEPTIDVAAGMPTDDVHVQTVRPKLEHRTRHKKKKGGPAKFLGDITGLLIVLGVVVVAALIYLLFFARR